MIRQITWHEVEYGIIRLDQEMNAAGWRPEREYIMPATRGGYIVAGLLQYWGWHISFNPADKLILVDDIYDTGATARRIAPWCIGCGFLFRRIGTDTPIFGLETKGDEWLRFPWEVNE